MRRTLSGKEVKELLEVLPGELRVFSRKDRVDLVDDLYLLNNRPFLIVRGGRLIPHLKFVEDVSRFKTVTVDMGAVKFVVAGADVMRPGIKVFSDFGRDDFVIIIDEVHRKPLAVGVALFGSEELKVMSSGKVIRNVHFVGDEFWGKA